MSDIEKKIKKDELLSKHTHFRIGGPADFFMVAESEDDIINAAKWAEVNKIPVIILGGGSNVLVLDKGFRGLVIKTENKNYNIAGTKVWVESGVVLMNLVNILAKEGLSGMEFGCGIYGTIGGAIRGNSGSFGREIKDVLLDANVYIPEKGKVKLSNTELKFDYRHSIIADNPSWFILSAEFNLEKSESDKVKAQAKELLNKKLASQPMNVPSSGCIFKNPILDKEKFAELKSHFAKEHGNASFWQTNSIGAGFLIDKTNLKGKEIGGAQVSDIHGSFIVNKGNATAEEVLMLISYIKQQVRDKYGVQLQEEIEILGE